MNIVIPMAGIAKRFQDAGYTTPKPFLELGGKPMIQQVIFNLSEEGDHVILLHRAEHRAEMEKLDPAGRELTFIPVDRTTEGQACTVLLAKDCINNDRPLLIANSDQWVEYSRREWREFLSQVDGGLMVFTNNDPKWSYARCDEDGRVVEVKEKEVISDCATVGVYFFKHGKDFCREAEAMIERDERVNGEFYVAPTYNALCSDREIYPFWISRMMGLGTPEDYEKHRPIVEELL